MIRHKLDVLGNTLNGEQEVLEAEEVEGKAPDGSTIDVFMEKILQKVLSSSNVLTHTHVHVHELRVGSRRSKRSRRGRGLIRNASCSNTGTPR
jgi:hypothetical protein